MEKIIDFVAKGSHYGYLFPKIIAKSDSLNSYKSPRNCKRMLNKDILQ